VGFHSAKKKVRNIKRIKFSLNK